MKKLSIVLLFQKIRLLNDNIADALRERQCLSFIKESVNYVMKTISHNCYNSVQATFQFQVSLESINLNGRMVSQVLSFICFVRVASHWTKIHCYNIRFQSTRCKAKIFQKYFQLLYIIIHDIMHSSLLQVLFYKISFIVS